MSALPPIADISAPVRQGGFRVHTPGRISPPIGSFGQTGTLGDFIHRLWPARLNFFHGLQGGIPGFGYLKGDMLLIPFPLFDNVLYGLPVPSNCASRFLDSGWIANAKQSRCWALATCLILASSRARSNHRHVT